MAESIVFVGGGPVGLWTAIQTKLQSPPNTDIVVLEKHAEYLRSHTLRIDPSSFGKIPENSPLAPLVERWKKMRYVPTKEIEGSLQKLAHELGIRTLLRDVKDPMQLSAEFPDARLFVGADGSHSLIRKTIFNDEMQYRNDFQYIAELKYLASQTRPFSKKESLKVSSELQELTSDHVGRAEGNEPIPVTCRIFIDEKTFNELKDEATFQHPLSIEDLDRKPHLKLAKQIKELLQQKKEKLGEEIIPGTFRATVTRLGSYASKTFVRDMQGRTWALVGDAAFGVPFFRSFNNGILCGTKLAETIAKQVLRPSRSFREYENYAQTLWKSQNSKAYYKDLALRVGRSFFHSIVPITFFGINCTMMGLYYFGHSALHGSFLKP